MKKILKKLIKNTTIVSILLIISLSLYGSSCEENLEPPDDNRVCIGEDKCTIYVAWNSPHDPYPIDQGFGISNQFFREIYTIVTIRRNFVCPTNLLDLNNLYSLDTFFRDFYDLNSSTITKYEMNKLCLFGVDDPANSDIWYGYTRAFRQATIELIQQPGHSFVFVGKIRGFGNQWNLDETTKNKYIQLVSAHEVARCRGYIDLRGHGNDFVTYIHDPAMDHCMMQGIPPAPPPGHPNPTEWLEGWAETAHDEPCPRMCELDKRYYKARLKNEICMGFKNWPSGPEDYSKAGNSIEIRIEPEFNSYLLKQRLWIKFELINNSDYIYYMKDRITAFDIDFRILNPEGENVPRRESVCGDFYTDSVGIKPGEKYQTIIPLHSYMRYERPKTGTYKIYCNFKGIKSNTIGIEFLEPTGNDKELYDITDGLLLPKSNREDLLDFKSYIDKYNESKYSTQLYNMFFVVSGTLENFNFYDSFINDYFTNYADFYETENILTLYILYLKTNKNLSNEELDDVIEDLRNKFKTEKSKILFDNFLKTTFKEIKNKDYE